MTEERIFTAPPGIGEAVLGKTLPDLLYEACSKYINPCMLNQPSEGNWRSYSLVDFRTKAEETALGLLELGLRRGDHVAFYMESDVFFCIADMGCLLAGLPNVPIYLTSSEDAIEYVIEHSESKALVVSNPERLRHISGLLTRTSRLETVIVAEMEASLPTLPDHVQVISLDRVRELGRNHLGSDSGTIERLRSQLHPHDLATIIYTSGTTGRPKGVMLTHENISFNAMTAFSGLTGYRAGPEGEVAVSFLPMTHIFARALHYGFVAHATSVYFTTPSDLAASLQEIRPTAFATVPRVLEKVYSRIQERMTAMTGWKKKLGFWAFRLAQHYELGQEPTGLARLKLNIADRLVFSKWRQSLGGKVRFVICGGAALNGELANIFGAAGVPVYQGYGLTETSPVIAYNRPERNRAGTVGEPLPGVEVMIAEDGEILTRGPHVMKGYFNSEEKTQEVLTEDGWFCTGDIGTFTEEGYLRITDRKKALFKLSTGKYVMPQPLENKLGIEGLIEHAVVVGAGHKFCTALIFPEQAALRVFGRSLGLEAEGDIGKLLAQPVIIEQYRKLVDKANDGMDHWSTIKRFVLVPQHLTVDNGLLTPTLKVKRAKVRRTFEKELTALYDEAVRDRRLHTGIVVDGRHAVTAH